MQNALDHFCKNLHPSAGIIIIAFVCFNSYPAYGNDITLDSQQHRIWGSAGEIGEKTIYESYDITDSTLITESASGSYFLTPEELEMSFSQASAGNFSIDLTAGRWKAEAYGTSTYSFTADHSTLFFYASGFTGQTDLTEKIQFAIVNDALQSEIYSYEFQAFTSTNQSIPIFDFDFSDQVGIIPEQKYLLYMYAEALPGDSPTSSRLSLSLYSKPSEFYNPRPAPEPGTLLFLSLGLAILSRRGRLQ